MVFITMNPATEERLAEYPDLTREEAAVCIEKSADAFNLWRKTPMSTRTTGLIRTAALLRERKAEYASLMSLEMGKPLPEAQAEIEKCAWVCEFYAAKAETFLTPKPVKSNASKSYVAYEPLGVILAIMPWNFPFWQVIRFAAPTLAAGNTVLLKHAPNVIGCALAIENIIREAGFPNDLFQVINTNLDVVETVIAHPSVKAVTLTGSTNAGRAVAALAGKHLKKQVLELGGSDPYVILEDADISAAAQACVLSRMINSGQSCIAAKRLIVVRAVRNHFIDEVHKLMKDKTFGDPKEATFDIGPLARADLRDNLQRQVAQSIHAGAKLMLGGHIPPGAGFFYPPTLLVDPPPGSPAYAEELFGPVAVIITAEDQDHALQLANDTPYGLGAAIFSADVDRAENIARTQLNAGACFVNDFTRSDPRLPFGGIGDSGYGRELSAEGIHEFVNVKTVYVK